MGDGEPTFSGFDFPSAPTDEEMAGYPLNDLGNAQRLIRLVHGSFRDDGSVDTRHCELLYLRDRGWIAFNGRHWDLLAGDELARRTAHRVARGLGGLYQQLVAREVPVKAAMDFIVRAGNAGASSAMLTQAAAYLAVALDDFDTDPLAINVRNGVLRFGRTTAGKPRLAFAAGHQPSDRFTRMAEVDYDPKAKSVAFDPFLAEVQPRPEMRAYIAKVFGYSSTGDTSEQAFFILQGLGGDGKSTLVNAVRDMLGTYAVTAAVETFLDTGAKRSAEASPDIARLAGDTRLVSTAEPPAGSKLASGAIKTFTGGGRIAARELRQGIFEFEPFCKILVECNRRPSISDIDDGIWRRLRIVPFEVQFPKAAQDRALPRKLAADRPAILNWLAAGILAWMADGLSEPPRVEEAIDDYRRGSNPFGEWRADRLVLDKESRVKAKDLYDDYKLWCDQQGHERPMTQTTFGRALGDLQVIRCGKDGSGAVLRRGARLRTLHDATFTPSPPTPPPASAFLAGDDDL
jgi:putative DNA primase/helicase